MVKSSLGFGTNCAQLDHFTLCGPYVQVFSISFDLIVPWMIEYIMMMKRRQIVAIEAYFTKRVFTFLLPAPNILFRSFHDINLPWIQSTA